MATYRQDGDWEHPLPPVDDVGLQQAVETGGVESIDIRVMHPREQYGPGPDGGARRGQHRQAVSDIADMRRRGMGWPRFPGPPVEKKPRRIGGIPPNVFEQAGPAVDAALAERLWKYTDWIMWLGFGIMAACFLHALIGFTNAGWIAVGFPIEIPTTAKGWAAYGLDHVGLGLGVALAGLILHFIIFLASYAVAYTWRRIRKGA
jgi:hypothetical protein